MGFLGGRTARIGKIGGALSWRWAGSLSCKPPLPTFLELVAIVFYSFPLCAHSQQIMHARCPTCDFLYENLYSCRAVGARFLQDSGLLDIPESTLGLLTDLRKLWLTQNALCAVPRDFCGLRSLTCLWLNGNQMKELPLEVIPFSASVGAAAPITLVARHWCTREHC